MKLVIIKFGSYIPMEKRDCKSNKILCPHLAILITYIYNSIDRYDYQIHYCHFKQNINSTLSTVMIPAENHIGCAKSIKHLEKYTFNKSGKHPKFKQCFLCNRNSNPLEKSQYLWQFFNLIYRTI